MTQPSGAVVDAPAPTTRGPAAAAALAARIQIPRRLPVRYDGQPIRHLSNSSYTRLLLCPEDWRRHYLKGERTPPTGAMFLGARVDDAVSGFYARQLEHGEILDLDQVRDLYRDRWHQQLANEHAKRGVRWEADLSEADAFALGLDALAVTFTELVPRLGRPVAVQRKLEFSIAEVEWTVQCYLDLEVLRDSDEHPEPVAEVVDYKVKSSPITQAKADVDRRPACTLPGAGSKESPRGRSGSRRSPSPAAGAST